MTIKIANRDKLSLELLLTTKQKTKARNTFQKKISIGIKLSRQFL